MILIALKEANQVAKTSLDRTYHTSIQQRQKKDSDAKNKSPNRGKLIIDVTWTPADITRYPRHQDIVARP